uniref:Uncharacterized protein n=1 Tax=Aegilops tauschii subsp. strangulata TaxID=200361 RepID=A0A452ZUV8_AEGTS
MPPFNGHCDIPEQQMEVGVITVAEKRCGHNKAAQREVQRSSQDEDVKNVRLIPPADSKGNGKRSSSGSMSLEGMHAMQMQQNRVSRWIFLRKLTMCDPMVLKTISRKPSRVPLSPL